MCVSQYRKPWSLPTPPPVLRAKENVHCAALSPGMASSHSHVRLREAAEPRWGGWTRCLCVRPAEERPKSSHTSVSGQPPRLVFFSFLSTCALFSFFFPVGQEVIAAVGLSNCHYPGHELKPQIESFCFASSTIRVENKKTHLDLKLAKHSWYLKSCRTSCLCRCAAPVYFQIHVWRYGPEGGGLFCPQDPQ